MTIQVRLVLVLFITVIFATTLSAQTCSTPCAQPPQTCTTPCQTTSTATPSSTSSIAGELYVNAGAIWPTRIDTFSDNKIKSQGIYGLKGGMYLGDNAELEGSFGYLNHFEPSRRPNPLDFNTVGTIGQPSILAFMYDVNFLWNFGASSAFGAHVSPYVVMGVGGLTAEVRHGESAFLDGGGLVPTRSGVLVPNPVPTRVISDGDTFFTVNYGGGIKAMNLWGPVGLRADFRGRTIPNFYHSSTTWPEVTGGLLFSFGER
jgi:hypothetical protein